MTQLMTLQEIADYLRLTEVTVYRLLKRRNIPAVKIGRSWRFEKAEIDAWLRNKSIVAEISILVIDDEELIGELFKETLKELGHVVMCAKTGSKGLELVKKYDFDLVFLDLKMPGMSGAELFRQIKTVKPKLTVTIITGYPESDLMAQALEQGPFGVMKKPFSESDIIAGVETFLKANH